MNSVLSLLNSDNYRTYNLHVARILGSLTAAIMLSELAQRCQYHKDRQELQTLKKHDGEWFYYTQELCEERTMLSREQQDSAIKCLEKLGWIKKVLAGVPPKRFFQLDELKILEALISSKNVSNLRETHKLNCGKSTNQSEGNPQYTKETKKEPLSKKTTNYPKKDSSSFPINRNLEALEQLALERGQKNTLYEKFDDETILQALSVYRQTKKEPDNLGSFLYAACAKGYKKSVSKQSLFDQNKAMCHKIFDKYDDLKERNGYKVMVLSKYIEFSSGSRVFIVNYDDADFLNQIKALGYKINPQIKF